MSLIAMSPNSDKDKRKSFLVWIVAAQMHACFYSHDVLLWNFMCKYWESIAHLYDILKVYPNCLFLWHGKAFQIALSLCKSVLLLNIQEMVL